MRTRTPAFLALVLVPLVSLSQEATPPPTIDPAAPRLTLSGGELRDIAREVARTRAESEDASLRVVAGADAPRGIPNRTAAALGSLPMRALRVAVRYDCLLHECKAYDADDNILYTLPRTSIAGADKLTEDQWLSCQSGDDMLSTFERFDKCRGVGIFVPTPWDAVLFRVPLTGID